MHDLPVRCLEKDYGSLGSLVIACGIPQRVIQAIARSVPDLTTLRAEHLQIESFFALPWWSRLTTLYYGAHDRDRGSAGCIQILDGITQCTLLRKLTLSMYEIRFTTDEIALYNSRSLPNLRRLDFVNVNCAMLFECPNLTHLSYTTNHFMPPYVASTVIHDTNEFRLERLMYCEIDSPFMGQYLAPLAAPNLQDLRIVTSWSSVKLHVLNVGVHVLKSTLEKMEPLKNLKMSRVEIAKTGLEILVIDPKDTMRSILCPELVTLDVDCSTPEHGGLKPILKEVAESRRIAGIPLESITYGNSRRKRWTCVKDDSGSPSLPIYSFHPLT